MIENSIIIYDGKCKLCNSSVNWIHKIDKKKQLTYVSNQSPQAKILLNKFQLKTDYPSIVYIYYNNIYTHSKAIIKICNHLGGYYKLVNIFYLLPNFLRDNLYLFIANNRYKWFGKVEDCETDSLH